MSLHRQNPRIYQFSVDSADVAQTVIPANGSRYRISIENLAGEGVPLYVKFGSAAVKDSTSIIIMPGGSIDSVVDDCPLDYVSVLSGKAGHTFKVKEYSSSVQIFGQLSDRPDASDFGLGVCMVDGAFYISNGSQWSTSNVLDEYNQLPSGTVLFGSKSKQIVERFLDLGTFATGGTVLIDADTFNNFVVTIQSDVTVNTPSATLTSNELISGTLTVLTASGHTVSWHADWDWGTEGAPTLTDHDKIGFTRMYGETKTRAWSIGGYT